MRLTRKRSTAAQESPATPTFELRDLDTFAIPDERTRLSALQDYLFPKLDRLVEDAVALVQAIYNTKVPDRYSPLRHPKFRTDARKPQSTNQVMSGLSPSRDGVATRMLKKDGTPYLMGPGELLFRVRSVGALQTVWLPFAWADDAHRHELHEAVAQHWTAIQYFLNVLNIGARCDEFRTSPLDTLSDKSAIWEGPGYPLPVITTYARRRLMLEFIFLFPLFDAGTRIARGHPHNLAEATDQFLAWAENLETWMEPSPDQHQEEVAREAVGHPVVRNKRRWAILARDNWSCCACGRSSRDGYTLEVDHITPRSKGGTDDEENLQTLCWLCNSGKSNLDQTDLRQ